MKHVRFGDILSVERGIIVHGCNAQGVMGSGVAHQIATKWHHVYEEYRKYVLKMISQKKSALGTVVPVAVNDNLFVFNAITQENFGRRPDVRYVNYQAVQKCFNMIAAIAATDKLPVHYPMIGAGLGNGEWSIISEIIDCAFAPYPHVERNFWLYEP